jgi:oxalate decarboxylase/phosphoglucose isomerase-like protein (cupin superfamily)
MFPSQLGGRKIMIRKFLLGLSVLAFACAGAALAQQGGIKRTPLQKAEFPDGYFSISGIAEIPAGGTAGRHTHPGVELGYVMEGEGELIIEGQPVRQIKVGDSWQIPAGTPHDAKASAGKPLKVLAVYVVDKSKPLATPAPEK